MSGQTRDEIQAERRLLRLRFGALYGRVSEILFRHDPIGINFGDNTDEYEPEVGNILPLVRSAGSVEEVERILHMEFQRWFGADVAGPRDRYALAAREVWEADQCFRAKT